MAKPNPIPKSFPATVTRYYEAYAAANGKEFPSSIEWDGYVCVYRDRHNFKHSVKLKELKEMALNLENRIKRRS